MLGELGHERHLELKKVTWDQRWEQEVSKKLERDGQRLEFREGSEVS